MGGRELAGEFPEMWPAKRAEFTNRQLIRFSRFLEYFAGTSFRDRGEIGTPERAEHLSPQGADHGKNSNTGPVPAPLLQMSLAGRRRLLRRFLRERADRRDGQRLQLRAPGMQ